MLLMDGFLGMIFKNFIDTDVLEYTVLYIYFLTMAQLCWIGALLLLLITTITVILVELNKHVRS